MAHSPEIRVDGLVVVPGQFVGELLVGLGDIVGGVGERVERLAMSLTAYEDHAELVCELLSVGALQQLLMRRQGSIDRHVPVGHRELVIRGLRYRARVIWEQAKEAPTSAERVVCAVWAEAIERCITEIELGAPCVASTERHVDEQFCAGDECVWDARR